MRTCRCGANLDVRSVWSGAGMVSVGCCALCDRRTCGHCGRKTGTLLVPGARTCDYCQGSVVLG